uniref:ATP-dependent nuclease n=1 Tax=Cellulomonas hominis TaxID=156981 RepID=UPI0022876B01|nr:AAA family ATPase [Cellulomonas hominis]
MGGAKVQLERVRACGFRSLGPDPVELELTDLTCLIGPNGSGKTAFLHGLARMFSIDPSLRKVVASDFHVPASDAAGAGAARQLWIEAHFTLPELADGATKHSTVPPFLRVMRMTSPDGPPELRIRLEADLDEEGEVTANLFHVLAADQDGDPTHKSLVNPHDRRAIQVHYVPARRDPGDHVSYAASTLLGRLLRSAEWDKSREVALDHARKLSEELADNPGVVTVNTKLKHAWTQLHKDAFLSSTNLSFMSGELERVLSQVSLEFSPGPSEPEVSFTRLSDGQQSLLYISLALAVHAVGREVLAGKDIGFRANVLQPAVFTLFAVEEPENSLSPHYLGRVLDELQEVVKGSDAQAVVATHSPSLMRRVQPEQVRYLRLDDERCTHVEHVHMPAKADTAHKFVREALHAYPELYFSQLVVLGEGDSEEIVLPAVLRAQDLGADAAAVSVVPLGGRHVNHFWSLLNGLNIPHVTLLDLDLGRYHGGWGQIRYAANQLLEHRREGLAFNSADVAALPRSGTTRCATGLKWIQMLEGHDVFFSSPLDLDFSMLQALPEAYPMPSQEDAHEEAPDGDEELDGQGEVDESVGHTDIDAADEDFDEQQREAELLEKKTVVAVLGTHGDAGAYTEDERGLFHPYNRLFKVGSKPANHLEALAVLGSSTRLKEAMPPELARLSQRVKQLVEGRAT